MKLLYVTSEAYPFCKTGGLADVAGSLPPALAAEGVETAVILPLYDKIGPQWREKMTFRRYIYVDLGWRHEYCGLFSLHDRGVTWYFVDNEKYFRRGRLYGEFDDGERFAFFSKAVVDLLPSLDWMPDILHCNDWQTALVPIYLKDAATRWWEIRHIRTVFTIHNIEYQGRYGSDSVDQLFGLDRGWYDDGTGISPAVITVENSDWQGNYSDLENYAYDLYVNHFADESHWLIVYSTPDGYSSSDGFEDWYWEGMQGNDTDDVLTESVTNSFNDELQKNLTARTRYTVSSAISTSFDDLTPTVMKSKVNWTMLFTSIAILAFVCLHACLMIGINPKARKYAKAKPCSDAAQEKACEYCGYTYVVDTCTECPHCGAPIPPEDQPGARFT